MAKARILSGMRPTGPLHLGNHIGALQNWALLQDEYECFYMVADWHALMSEYENSSAIAGNTREMVADWVADGLDPQRSVIFRQSDVPAHAELHLILSAVTPLGWLERCPTYKEQLRELGQSHKDVSNYAFLGYPVLQAADILVYRADAVPVGEDQLPHLEITREIARRFNNVIGTVFPEPQAKLVRNEEGQRLLGLDRRKMSKSYDNAIYLRDDADTVKTKVMSMITDPQRQRKSDPGRPEYCNVHTFYRLFAPDLADEVAEKCRQAAWGCVACKQCMADRLNQHLEPIRGRRQEFLSDSGHVDAVLSAGADRAREVAGETMAKVHEVLGF